MRGERTLKILEVLVDAAGGVVDGVDVFLSSSYGASWGTFQRELSKRDHMRAAERRRREDAQKLYSLIYKLKRDKLIQESSRGCFRITTKGIWLLKKLRGRAKQTLPSHSYLPEKSDRFTIIAFDIPEREGKKRRWLRSTLSLLGFYMVQKSVWVGKVKIPKQFLQDLHELSLIDFVEIFEITKTGSLRAVA